MSEKDNGGPAFPIPLNDGQVYQGHAPCDGMTLRDYMAAKTLQGMLANPGGPLQRNDQCAWSLTNCTFDELAEFTYELADAMLKARSH